MDEEKIHDNSNGTNYESYPCRKSNLARLHVESQNEGVVSALENLKSKLRQLQQDKAKPQNARKEVSDPDLPCRQELEDVENKCQTLQNSLLNVLKIVRFEEKSDLALTDIDVPDAIKPREGTVLKSRSIKLPPTSAEPKVNNENKPVGNAVKTCRTKLGNDYKHHHHRLTIKQLPFVLSGMTGKSFSLPVNIQLLVASLKTHNPWMCALASDCAAMQESILKVEHDLKDAIAALKDSIGYLTLESCSIRKQIVLPRDKQDQRIQQITNRRNVLIAHMQMMDALIKQLHNFKEQLNSPGAIPSTTVPEAERGFSNVNAHPAKHKKLPVDTTKQHIGKMKTSRRQIIRRNIRPPWNDRVTPDAIPPRRLSVSSIKYRELLQVALKRNGYKLRERET